MRENVKWTTTWKKTDTATRLRVKIRVIDKLYKAGRKYAADFKEMMVIQFDDLLPKWNYVAIPDAVG
ncbi:hypothetical protein M3P05_05470 [Sansalvadorimonas sp. 2012CJ34-2]|uniref:Transposase n=2 Tax=Parendozoicomonas callyspongiae TaxID=2942213 RepID=A0ABT0PDI2_9GAMM|nr:hypothetical protein [Sansalvadorimonas sp. 2012CJ34-2]